MEAALVRIVALVDDVRYSVRALARTPGATLALIVSAGIGIGANAVVFGFIGPLVDPAAVLPATGVDGVQARLDTIRTLLVAGAVFVFVIAAATVAGLLLSRGAARGHETSVRVTLGAHGRDLLRPLLAEGLVVGIASVAVGLLAALWTGHGLPALFYEEDVEALPFVVDWPGLAAATCIGALVAAGGALAPLAWTSRQRPAPDSRGTGPGLANTFGGWRSTLVMAQLTLCAVALDLVGLTLVLGRSFDARDTVRSRTVVLVNEEAARLLGRAGTPLVGMRLIDDEGQAVEIIGLVREAPFRTLQPRPRPTIHFAYAQRYPSTLSMVVSLNGPVSQAVMSSLAAELDAVKDGRVTSVTSMQEHLTLTSTAADRLITTVVRVFAALAVLLSLIGVTGVTADAVARQRAEIALRMALGAPRWRIIAGVVAHGGRLGATGALAGMGICLVAFRFVAPMLDGSRGPAVWVWAGAFVILMTVVLLGSIVPARRAAAVDPAMLWRE